LSYGRVYRRILCGWLHTIRI